MAIARKRGEQGKPASFPKAIAAAWSDLARTWVQRHSTFCTGVLLFVVTLGIYLSKPILTRQVPQPSADNIPTRLLPVSLITEGNFALDEFPGLVRNEVPYFLQKADGHIYSAMPIGNGLLLTPIYWLAYHLGVPVVTSDDARLWLALITAAVASALAVVVTFATYAPYDCKRALALAVIFGFGTGVWSLGSWDLWQHTTGVLWLSLCLLCLDRGRDNPRWLGWMGLPIGLLFMVRPANAILIAILGVIVLWRNPRQIVLWSLLSVPFLVGIIYYNVSHTGYLLGEYRDEAARIVPWEWMGIGIPGLLISPARGLFVYSPFVLLAVWAFQKNRPSNWEPKLFLALLAVQIGIYGSYGHWYGGYCFGPRFLLEVMPAAMGLLWYTWPTLTANLTRRIVLGAAIAWSVFANGVGYACGYFRWCDNPSIDRFPERLWSFSDNPIASGLFGLPPGNLFLDSEGFDPFDIEGVHFQMLGGWNMGQVKPALVGSSSELRVHYRGKRVGALVLQFQPEPGCKKQDLTAYYNGQKRAQITLGSGQPEKLFVPISVEDLKADSGTLKIESTVWTRRSALDPLPYAGELVSILVGLRE